MEGIQLFLFSIESHYICEIFLILTVPEYKYFFYRDLSFGRGQTAPVKGAEMPKIITTEPWDGKDGELPPEEDIDLSDVDLEKDEL